MQFATSGNRALTSFPTVIDAITYGRNRIRNYVIRQKRAVNLLDGSQAEIIFTKYLFDCFTFLFLLVGIELRLKFKYFTLLGGRKVLGVCHFDMFILCLLCMIFVIFNLSIFVTNRMVRLNFSIWVFSSLPRDEIRF